jgi:peptidoglycan/xylan/chitin deacetylase (PgdA/CDA1 family)
MRNPLKRATLSDRRHRWTLFYAVLLVALSGPLWNAAVHFSASRGQENTLRVPILVYHSIAAHHPGQTPEQRLLDVDTTSFQRQMNYLAGHHFNVISLETLVSALDGKANIPANSVVITFDDGWGTQYRDAYPVLKEFHYTATFFIVTSQINHAPLYMTLAQLRELQADGMTIASHTRTHPDLAKVTNAVLKDEVEGSRQDLQREMGFTPDLFAYPYGIWNPRAAAEVQAAGYRAARAFPGGAFNNASDQFALHAVLVTDDMVAFEKEITAPGAIARRGTSVHALFAAIGRGLW